MSLLTELKKSLKVAVEQITSSSHVTPPGKPNAKAIQFTRKFDYIAKQAGLTEADALDVYHHGESGGKENSLVRKYNGYAIGIFYFLDKQTGQPVITSIKKWDRR